MEKSDEEDAVCSVRAIDDWAEEGWKLNGQADPAVLVYLQIVDAPQRGPIYVKGKEISDALFLFKVDGSSASDDLRGSDLSPLISTFLVHMLYEILHAQ